MTNRELARLMKKYAHITIREPVYNIKREKDACNAQSYETEGGHW